VSLSRYDLGRGELSELLAGEPPYRTAQLFEGLYAQHREPAEITVLPEALRARLEAEPAMQPALKIVAVLDADRGQTRKWRYRLGDGAEIESVLMAYDGRATVCLSSQAGCAMGCTFCATGQGGFTRQLGVGEIVEQVVRAARAASDLGAPRLTNVVFMGMGEPLANYDRVLGATRRIVTDLGLAQRHVTISTVGIVPGIRRLAAEALQVGLAVSLHAANDELRSRLVPINRRYPISMLIEACGAYREQGGRRLSLEWALIDDVNDHQGDADELSAIARELRAHVNLIPLNPTPGYPVRGSSAETVRTFAGRLLAKGVNVTVRRTRGAEIAAACGQLSAPVVAD
jgi:23S rRNA (adenine2503-C2)-methyltransferase